MSGGARTAVYSLSGSTGVLLTLESPIDTRYLRIDRILIGSKNHLQLADHLNHAASAASRSLPKTPDTRDMIRRCHRGRVRALPSCGRQASC